MELLETLGEPLTGKVSADAIEEALAVSWNHARAPIRPDYPSVRASVLSLVVCIVDRDRAPATIATIHALSRRHPSRVIILLPSGDSSQDSLEVWHGTHCFVASDRENVICREQVTVVASGRAVGYFPSLADQLVLTDLPSFLWWDGDLLPSGEPLFDRLTGLADRLIVDSAEFSTLGASLKRVANVTQRRRQRCAPSDLSWARLTHWRELVSQFFDAPTLLPYLQRLTEVQVEYGGESGALGRSQALLFLSWIAYQLRWHLVGTTTRSKGGAIQSQFRRSNGGVIEVTLGPSPSRTRGISRIALRSGNEAAFVATRSNDENFVLTEANVTGTPELRRMAHFDPPDLTTALADELLLFRRDHVYEAALRGAVAIAGEE